MTKTGKKSNRALRMVVGSPYRTSRLCCQRKVSGKAKIICARLYEQCIVHEQALDEQQIYAGQRDSPRDEAAIAGTLKNPLKHQQLITQMQEAANESSAASPSRGKG
ncbi:hypothetical protein BDR04DRAFT_1089706 [Suillus decipiens]|nr:hypothetical protein BDR04DRAFT_1089706 [Suillus decipiens]